MRTLLLSTLCLALVGTLPSCRSDGPSADPSPVAPQPVIELDHVYTYAPRGVPEEEVVDALRSAGLRVDEERNDFPDGVFGRYAFFGTTYLEILWVDADATADESTLGRAGWETSGSSPFGVGFRRREGAPDALPFPSRAESAEWMEPGSEMRVLNSESETLTPALFVVPRYMAMTSWGDGELVGEVPPKQREIELTGVRIETQPECDPRPHEGLVGTGVVIGKGDGPVMELTFGPGASSKVKDLRPTLPIVLRMPASAR
ncbi:MAG: hypothetical protein AAF726_09950 [Planctomycetota bacterium]